MMLALILALAVNSPVPTPNVWDSRFGIRDSGFDQARYQAAQRHGRIFPPEDLGLLETPDRAAWQKPEQVMDALNIADGATVADIGAGAGWFTIRLAGRVGPNGLVYAQDVQDEMIEAIARRVRREALNNVRTRRGEGSNPNLPAASLDAALVVDTYQEVRGPEQDDPARQREADEQARVTFLRNLAAALKPKGRIGIVNHKPGSGGPGPDADVRVNIEDVEAAAREAGLRVIARENLPYQYLLVLSK